MAGASRERGPFAKGADFADSSRSSDNRRHTKTSMGKATILVIEDEEKQRRVVGLHLAGADYEVKGAGTAEEGWKLAGDVALILTDLKLPGMDGLELLEKLKAQNSHTPVVVMSAFSTVENAVAP